MTFPTPTNITGFGKLGQYIHSVDGNFFTFLLLAIWFIMFIHLKSREVTTTGGAFTIASFGIFILSLFLIVPGIIANNVIIISLIMVAVGIVWMFNEGR